MHFLTQNINQPKYLRILNVQFAKNYLHQLIIKIILVLINVGKLKNPHILEEKIESQLFGDGISEEEVISELSQQLEDTPSVDNITSASPSDNTDQAESASETSESTDSVNDSAVTTDVIKPE